MCQLKTVLKANSKARLTVIPRHQYHQIGIVTLGEAVSDPRVLQTGQMHVLKPILDQQNSSFMQRLPCFLTS